MAAMLALSQAVLALDIKPTEKYRIEVQCYSPGAMATGAGHGSSALVYYVYGAVPESEDIWWEFVAAGSGYNIRNSATGQYLYYDPEREEAVAKGIRLAESPEGDEAVWSVEEVQGGVAIRNAAQPMQYFNVRMDGSFLVGTYMEAGALTSNEIFKIYDSNGDDIQQGGGTPVVPEDLRPDPEYFTYGSTSGVNNRGESWERRGMEVPVVYTESTSSPVYYTIMNVRRGSYVEVKGGRLYQTTDPESATQFYFKAEDGNTAVFTRSGLRVGVAAAYESGNYNNAFVKIEDYGDYIANGTWKLSFFQDSETPGYLIERQGYGGYYSVGDCWNDYSGTGICYWEPDGGSTFVFASSDERHKALIGSGGEVPLDTDEFAALVDSIRFDGKDLVRRNDNGSYMYSLNERLRGGADYSPEVEVVYKDPSAGYSILIDGKVADGASVRLGGVTCARPYRLQVMQGGEEKAAADLYFTFLPIVEVDVPHCNGSTYTAGTIRVNYAGTPGYDSTYIAAYRYRGATAQGFDKKSFAIKLRDDAGNSVDRKFIGLRSDNNWILDAAAVDPSCMRNRVATDLWNDFAHDYYHFAMEPKARKATRGRFVEVLYNGSYHGVYCMTEKVDRKQLKLKKLDGETVHGTLYKSTDWTYETFFGHEINDVSYVFPARTPATYSNLLRREVWQGFEVKYPDYESEPIDWKPLRDAINFCATSTDADFAAGFGERFDRPVMEDYYLFIDLILATDNHGKNLYFFTYDSQDSHKIGIAPWDLDGVWGARWDGSEFITRATQDFPAFLDRWEHGQFTPFYRMAQIPSMDWHGRLSMRYAELRGGFFSKESLAGRFADYEALLSESGAEERETARWGTYHKDIRGDVEYITQWISDRVDFLDGYYGYDPAATGISYAGGKAVYACGGSGEIIFRLPEPTFVKVYSSAGTLVSAERHAAGFSRISGLSPGIYIANGRKVAVR